MFKAYTKILVSLILTMLMFSAMGYNVTAASEPENEDEPYTNYWIISQNPENTTAYIYAKYGADVTFDGMNVEPITVHIDPGVLTTYIVSDLGFEQQGTEWYYLEMKSTKPIMVTFDRIVKLRTGEFLYEDFHNDALLKKPPMDFNLKYYFAFGQSGGSDDKLGIYTHEPTMITLRRFTIFGEEYIKTISVDGLFISPKIRPWLGRSNFGYGLTVTADKPIAAALFDENRWWPSGSIGSGYYNGNSGHIKLYDEYMHIHYKSTEYHTLYTLDPNSISYTDMNGDPVGTRTFNGETVTHPWRQPIRMYFSDIGYNDDSLPFLVHAKGTTPFADYQSTPVATDYADKVAYMGYNASHATLEIYSDTDAEIKIVNGINNSLINFSMIANSIISKYLDLDLGFTPNEPFLINIISTVPVYSQIRNPYYLRHYPSTIGPGLEPTIRIEPETINLKSKGQFTAFIKLPDGFELENIDISTIVCEGAQAIDGNVADNNHLLVKFNRQDLVGVEAGDEVTFTVEGYFYDGTPFVGWDIVRVIDNGK